MGANLLIDITSSTSMINSLAKSSRVKEINCKTCANIAVEIVSVNY